MNIIRRGLQRTKRFIKEQMNNGTETPTTNGFGFGFGLSAANSLPV